MLYGDHPRLLGRIIQAYCYHYLNSLLDPLIKCTVQTRDAVLWSTRVLGNSTQRFLPRHAAPYAYGVVQLFVGHCAEYLWFDTQIDMQVVCLCRQPLTFHRRARWDTSGIIGVRYY
jgi:hypothetical protein